MASVNTRDEKIDDLVRRIDEDSYVVIEGAVSDDTIAAISRELDLWRFPMNANDVHAVAVRNGAYFSHALAKSPTLFHLVTDPFVLELSRARLGSDCRLKCHRVYSIYRGFDQPWHTDNKAHGSKLKQLDGLVFIVYFKDVIDGELQLLRGSHKWNERYPYSIFDDEVVNLRHKSDVVALKRPKGTLVVYDAKAVHRATPIRDPHWHRTSLFFQVDSYGGDAEKTLLDASFLDNMSPEVMSFLGFGKPSTYPTAPSDTSLATLLPSQLLDVQKQLIVAFARTSARGLVDLLPREIKHRLQNLVGKEVKWNTTFNTQ